MEEYNPIDWGNIDGVKSEIDVHQEWLILQNNIRKKKKRHRYLLLFWPFLFCAMMAFYLFNTSNKENVLVSQSKITSEQKDSKSLTTNEKGSLLLTNNENNEQSSKSSENSSQEQKHIILGSAKSDSDQLIKNAFQTNKKTKQIASVSKEQTENKSLTSQNETDAELTKQLPNTLSSTEKQGSLAGGEANAAATAITGAIHKAVEDAGTTGKKLLPDQIREKEESELKKYAEDNGILIENNFGEPDRFGNEQDVYVNKDGTTVTSYIAESILVEIAVMLDIQ